MVLFHKAGESTKTHPHPFHAIYALQRTAPRVTLAAADHPAACAHPAPAAFPQPARRAPQSLSLGSLGVMHTPSAPLLPRVFPGGLLRRLRMSDLAAFQAYRCIPELGRFQGWSSMSQAEAVAFLAEMHEARLFTLGDWVQLGIAD